MKSKTSIQNATDSIEAEINGWYSFENPIYSISLFFLFVLFALYFECDQTKTFPLCSLLKDSASFYIVVLFNEYNKKNRRSHSNGNVSPQVKFDGRGF